MPTIEAIAADPKLFREKIFEFYRLTPNDWTDWELDWMESQIRKPAAYVRSEKEQAILVRLHKDSDVHLEIEGKPTDHWLQLAIREMHDLGEDDQDFLLELQERRLPALRRRQHRRLLRILNDVSVLERAA